MQFKLSYKVIVIKATRYWQEADENRFVNRSFQGNKPDHDHSQHDAKIDNRCRHDVPPNYSMLVITFISSELYYINTSPFVKSFQVIITFFLHSYIMKA